MFWNGMMLLSTLLARTASVRQRTGAYGVDFFICVGLVRSRNNPFHIVFHFFDVYFAWRDLQIVTPDYRFWPQITDFGTGFTDSGKWSYDRCGPPQSSGQDVFFIAYRYNRRTAFQRIRFFVKY